jgi:nucleoside-diphosphate-sugar epimerase
MPESYRLSFVYAAPKIAIIALESPARHRVRFDSTESNSTAQPAMSSMVILGAGGFIGRTLVVDGHSPLHIKAVARNIPVDVDIGQRGTIWFEADLSKAASVDDLLGSGDVVINLAYNADADEADNIAIIDNIINACLRARVSRLLHCSTAVVVGSTRVSRVVESTPCLPLTPYERTKWALEQRVLGALPRGLDVCILRPTAVVGPGGHNLRKLAKSLVSESAFTNYLRASLFGRRPTHLVPVRNVTAALLHLSVLPAASNGNTYIVSSDDDPNNNFRNIEDILLRSLGLQPRKLPLLPIPSEVLSLALRALGGRSELGVARIYDSGKLYDSGFKPIDSVANAVREFGESQKRRAKGILSS